MEVSGAEKPPFNMPIYNFKCERCETTTSDLLPMNHGDISCPNCGNTMIKLFSTSNAHYKGKGFYSTDYKDSDKPKT